MATALAEASAEAKPLVPGLTFNGHHVAGTMNNAMQGQRAARSMQSSMQSLAAAAARRLRGSMEPASMQASKSCGKCMNEYTNQWGEQVMGRFATGRVASSPNTHQGSK